jgi:hypothetical protein
MSSIRTVLRTWRAIALVTVAAALAALAPSSATAAYTTYSYYGSSASVGSIASTYYRGYAHITGVSGCPVGASCIWANPQPIIGYAWNNGTWQRYHVSSGRYYVAPYSGQWRWVYTGAGWLIVGQATFTVA